jgi:hypothetical protein
VGDTLLRCFGTHIISDSSPQWVPFTDTHGDAPEVRPASLAANASADGRTKASLAAGKAGNKL